MMNFINAFLEYQESFNHKPVLEFMREHDEVLVGIIVAYLTLVFWVPEILKKPVTFLSLPMALWNLFLGIFSILGTYFITIDFVKLVYKNGFVWSICTSPEKSHVDGTLGFWLMLFILSKIPELLDTAFLILLKKEVIFLQWWHHVATCAFCWYAYRHQIATGWWFAAINYGVHGVMYPYFAASYYKSLRPLLRTIAPLITSLQIIQMFVGLFVLFAQRYYHHYAVELHGRECENYHEAANKLGIGMYLSYAILFGALFKRNYLSGGKKKPAQQKEEVVVLGKDGKTLVRDRNSTAVSRIDDDSLCNATAEAMREIHGSDPTQFDTAASPKNKKV